MWLQAATEANTLSVHTARDIKKKTQRICCNEQKRQRTLSAPETMAVTTQEQRKDNKLFSCCAHFLNTSSSLFLRFAHIRKKIASSAAQYFAQSSRTLCDDRHGVAMNRTYVPHSYNDYGRLNASNDKRHMNIWYAYISW